MLWRLCLSNGIKCWRISQNIRQLGRLFRSTVQYFSKQNAIGHYECNRRKIIGFSKCVQFFWIKKWNVFWMSAAVNIILWNNLHIYLAKISVASEFLKRNRRLRRQSSTPASPHNHGSEHEDDVTPNQSLNTKAIAFNIFLVKGYSTQIASLCEMVKEMVWSFRI